MAEIDAYLSGDTIECLLCHAQFKSLANHIGRRHGVSGDEYKRLFGIPIQRGLRSEPCRQIHSEQSKLAWQGRSQEDKATRVAKMIAAKPFRTTDAKTHDYAPAVKRARTEFISSRPNRPSLLHTLLRDAPCVDCGAKTVVNAMYAKTSPKRVLCDTCRYERQKDGWRKKHSEHREYNRQRAAKWRAERALVMVELKCSVCGAIFFGRPRRDNAKAVCSRRCGGLKAHA